ncbi:MAG: hypothetical protein Q4E52_06625 [Fibrobacter sp.]|nr:hypothetical protein [Fibrobacter sp.]
MKAFAMLFAVALILVACKNEGREMTRNQNVQAEQEVDNPAEVQKQILNTASLESATRENVRRIVPPKPKTAGAFDFSECESKFGSGTDEFHSCVQVKYPNIKFVK